MSQAGIADAIPLRRAPTNLRALLQACLDVMRSQATAADVSLTLQLDDGVPDTVTVDADKIAWAITALIGSALRYVRHGSRSMPGGVIGVWGHPHTGDLVIEVYDDGPGIPPEKTRSGLALGMIRDLVGAHGGALEIDSFTDPWRHGTSIRLRLPAA